MTSNKWGAVTKIIGCIGFIQVVWLCLAASTFAELVVYPQVPGLSSSPTYSMTVNGTPVPVQSYSGNSFAWFAFSGTVTVQVTANATISTYTLSPKRNQTVSILNGNNVTFSLSQPRKLVLHKVNAIAEKLFILADALESSPPILGAAGVLNVQSYGANPSGVADSTSAIQNTINAAAALPGGGVAYVPAGLYTVNASINLKANTHLYLAPGAVIKNLTGSYTSITAYIINNVNNVRISGRGVFYGFGTTTTSYLHMMATDYVNNFQIQDVMLLDSHSTALRLGNTSNSNVTNVKILSGSPNLSDGIDTDGVTNVTVDRSFIWSSDDNLAIGSGSSSFSYKVASNTDGYTIKNSLFYHFRTGHVLSCVPYVPGQYIQNVLFENNDSISVQNAFAMYASSGPVDINHFTIRNVRVEEIRVNNLDMISTDFTTWGGCPNGFCNTLSGKVHHITFDNVVFDTLGTTNGQIYGRSATQNIDTVNFNAVYMAGTLVTNASTGRLTIGSNVSNVVFTNAASAASDTAPPTPPSGLQIR